VPEPFIDRLVRTQNWLDGLGDFIQKVIGAIYKGLGAPGRMLQNLLHGTTLLGHPLHPAITDLPIGAWTVGVVLDYVAVFSPVVPAAAGDIALLVGVIAGVLAIATGYTDFHDTFGHERRLALAHGLTMSTVAVVRRETNSWRWPLFQLAYMTGTAWVASFVIYQSGRLLGF